jgi:uroporphyrinogen decarboxylase
MNSRERILATIAGKATDRVPCSFYATDAVARRLAEHFGAGSHREVLDRLHADMFNIRGFIDPVWKGPFPKNREIASGVTENYLGWRTKRVQTEYGFEEFHCDHVFATAQTPEDIDRFRWPKVDWFDFSAMPGQLRREYDGLATMTLSASVYQHPQIARGLDNFLCDLLVNPELADTLIDRYTEFYLAYYDKMFSTCPGQIDVLKISDDVGTQNRPLINVDLFRRFVKPNLKKLIDMAHSHGVKVMYHSCGSIIGFIDEIIDAGADVLDPI